MSNALDNLRESLDKALALIEGSQLLSTEKENSHLATHLDFPQSSSLLERCNSVEKQYQKVKPTLRIVHHPACSGGSLISKFLATMPNVTLLSEIHPNTELHLNWSHPHYTPTDIISLTRYAKVHGVKNFIEELFIDSIVKLSVHVEEYGSCLVLRDHTHADFFTEGGNMQSTLVNTLSDYFDIKAVMTIRDPIDSYISLVRNGWVHFKPSSFEEYCSRLLAMLDVYQDQPLFTYEAIIKDPNLQMKKICEILDIQYSDDFDSIFGIVRVTGDSGRSSDVIASKPRRKIEESLQLEIEESDSYKTLCNMLGY